MNTSSPTSRAAADPTASSAWDVCVIGLGYVGLPTAAVLATRGQMKICGTDTRNDVVATINEGKIHIVEPELDALVRASVSAGRLRAFATPQPADAFLICVPTPFGPGHTPDLSYVESATRALVPVLRPGNLVVLESTSPPGTTRTMVAGILAQAGLVAGQDVYVAHAPERVLPGAVIREVVENARVVGGVTPACTEVAAAFYERFVAGEVLRCTADAAELVKLSENAFRDVNIAFANELSNVCDALDLDVWEVIKLANRHPRVNILRPGPGVGGHCIAVDPWFIIAVAPEHTPLIAAARRVNDQRPHRVVAQVRTVAERFKRPKIACLGLSYKPDIDDVRESPAIEVVRELAAADFGDVVAVEPHLQNSPIPGVPLVGAEEALRTADIVVVLVAHRAFARLRREWFNRPSVVDTVGLLTR